MNSRITLLVLALNRKPKRSRIPIITSTDRSSMPLSKLMTSLDLTHGLWSFHRLTRANCFVVLGLHPRLNLHNSLVQRWSRGFEPVRVRVPSPPRINARERTRLVFYGFPSDDRNECQLKQSPSNYSTWQPKRECRRVDRNDTFASERELRRVSPALMKRPRGLVTSGMLDQRQ